MLVNYLHDPNFFRDISEAKDRSNDIKDVGFKKLFDWWFFSA
jgi:hypothetical protein